MVSKMKTILILLLIVNVINSLESDNCTNEESSRSLNRQGKLLYPTSTTYQISMCLVMPVSGIKSHVVAVNIGFQINYNLPFQLKDFYSPMYWARSLSNIGSIANKFIHGIVDDKSNGNDTVIETTLKPKSKKKKKKKPKTKIKRDLSAGQLYAGLKQTMSYSGYHEDCLLKSVCELAKTPLHSDEDNVLNEIIHFVLTPSLHQGFKSDETKEQEAFEEAEMYGKDGGDCELIYGNDCDISPLHIISNLNQLNLETS